MAVADGVVEIAVLLLAEVMTLLLVVVADDAVKIVVLLLIEVVAPSLEEIVLVFPAIEVIPAYSIVIVSPNRGV